MQGVRFILRDATVAIGLDETGKKIAITIPAGTEIAADVVPLEPTADHTEQIDVSWKGRTLSMFLTDLQNRAERIRPQIRPSGHSPRKPN
jgi:hypothetical protein